MTLQPPPLPPFPPHPGRAPSWQPGPALVGTPPHLCVQGPPLPVRAPCSLGCCDGNERWSRPGNSAGNTDPESHHPGLNKPPSLRRLDLEGQETGSASALLRCLHPAGSQPGDSDQPSGSGAPLYPSTFMTAPPFPLSWSPPRHPRRQQVSKRGKGERFKSLSWRARSLGLGLPWWLRR